MNQVALAGRLTRDVDFKYATSGTALAKFGLAVNEKYRDKETVTFVDVTAFGRTAESLQASSRGSFVCVHGKLQMDEWTDKQSGQKRSKLGVIAHAVYFGGGLPAKKQEATAAGEPQVQPQAWEENIF